MKRTGDGNDLASAMANDLRNTTIRQLVGLNEGDFLVAQQAFETAQKLRKDLAAKPQRDAERKIRQMSDRELYERNAFNDWELDK